MVTKLTLTVEKSVIEKAKIYAKKTGRSLSELIEHYLDTITDEQTEVREISPKLKRLVGAVKLPPDFDEKAALGAYLKDKYL